MSKKPAAAPKQDPKKQVEQDTLTPFSKTFFRFSWEAYHEGGHYIKIKRKWLNPETLQQEEAVSEMFKDWTLLRKDGEELPPPVAEIQVQP